MSYRANLDQPVFSALRRAVSASGFESYIVGGFVRDHFLGRESKDIDIVSLGNGLHLAREFANLVQAKDVVTFENFGTALVKWSGYEVEFVGARKESYGRDSRKPLVSEGTFEEDQLRRDFTINALYFSLNEGSFGELFDPFGGIYDLNNGILKTPTDPNITFSDDPLRMMRAIRFATQLEFSIHPQTWEALIRNRERIEIISMERVSEELNKIILSAHPSIGFKLLHESGLLQLIFPELEKMHGVKIINGKGHKDNFYHTLQVLENVCLATDDLWLRWSAILHDIAKPLTAAFDPQFGWSFHGHEDKGARMVPKIFTRMRLPLNEHMKFVQKMVRLHLRPIALVDNEVTDSAIRRLIVDAGDDLEALMKLCRADITTRDSKKVKKFLSNFDYVEERIEEVEKRDNLRNWQPPITGEIIMHYFNINPGPIVGEIKNAVREAILEGTIPNDFDPAFELMKELGSSMISTNNNTDAK